MTFEALMAQTLDLLQRQGWVSFQTLRRRYQVDEITLVQLQQVLHAAHPVTTDETGTRLVWQGELRPAAGLIRPRDVVQAAAPTLPPAVPAVAGAAPQPFEGERLQGVTPLVGRTQEVALLRA